MLNFMQLNRDDNIEFCKCYMVIAILSGQNSSTAVDDEMCLQLVGEYMLYRDDETTAEALHTVSCRLLLDIMPGLETSVIFQDNVSSMLYVLCDKRQIEMIVIIVIGFQ